MKGKLIYINILFLISTLFFSPLNSEMKNHIVAKVGNSLITSIDIENEIISNLIINKIEITQDNINKNKDYALRNLINKLIKREEINKYKITKYNKEDLQNYSLNVAKSFDTNVKGLKEIFKKYNANYETFLRQYETELLWNTLIYSLYRDQMNINIVEVENEIANIVSASKKVLKIDELKENILNKKKETKLSLFSRSHFSNLENTISIKFQ